MSHRGLRRVASFRPYKSKQVGDTGPVESARRSNSRALGSPFSGLTGQHALSFFQKSLKTTILENTALIRTVVPLTKAVIGRHYCPYQQYPDCRHFGR